MPWSLAEVYRTQALPFGDILRAANVLDKYPTNICVEGTD
jgi:hypothetical protein